MPRKLLIGLCGFCADTQIPELVNHVNCPKCNYNKTSRFSQSRRRQPDKDPPGNPVRLQGRPQVAANERILLSVVRHLEDDQNSWPSQVTLQMAKVTATWTYDFFIWRCRIANLFAAMRVIRHPPRRYYQKPVKFSADRHASVMEQSAARWSGVTCRSAVLGGTSIFLRILGPPEGNCRRLDSR
ncbi:hypothetical protein K470DRAFT_268724 [Piedraia hortae CBS 480.64]|uniref:Uncharacterized protein n=1 Tax=Piedraia hortae CBS 480.64 TaxID=1314780 RepID=A0A6A7C6S8_9PEZI|nr:hypothetical protein K470DRAFT_268724 [Piedraia hortae CBS 480.64]